MLERPARPQNDPGADDDERQPALSMEGEEGGLGGDLPLAVEVAAGGLRVGAHSVADHLGAAVRSGVEGGDRGDIDEALHPAGEGGLGRRHRAADHGALDLLPGLAVAGGEVDDGLRPGEGGGERRPVLQPAGEEPQPASGLPGVSGFEGRRLGELARQGVEAPHDGGHRQAAIQ